MGEYHVFVGSQDWCSIGRVCAHQGTFSFTLQLLATARTPHTNNGVLRVIQQCQNSYKLSAETKKKITTATEVKPKTPKAGSTGVALTECQLLIQEILDQREIDETPAGNVVAIPIVHRGGRTAEDRIMEINKLLAKGILTQREYEKKRKEIIDSI
jgi:hypothetical protein